MARRISIWFIGTSSFAVPSLKALLNDDRFSVDLVITQPDRPVGRQQLLTPPPVKPVALKAGVKVLQPEDLNASDLELGAGLRPAASEGHPDFLLVVSYGQILKQKILDLPRIAPINVHGSLLPRWRGASPIQHAILAGDTESGVTVQKMVKELDAGPILAQEKTPIAPRETYLTLHDRLAEMGAALLLKTLASPLHPVDQDESAVTICHKLTRDHGLITPAMEAQEADRMVRALNPWPGARIVGKDGKELKILESSLTPKKDSCPWQMALGTELHLVTVQPAGGKAMSGGAWMRGRAS